MHTLAHSRVHKHGCTPPEHTSCAPVHTHTRSAHTWMHNGCTHRPLHASCVQTHMHTHTHTLPVCVRSCTRTCACTSPYWWCTLACRQPRALHKGAQYLPAGHLHAAGICTRVHLHAAQKRLCLHVAAQQCSVCTPTCKQQPHSHTQAALRSPVPPLCVQCTLTVHSKPRWCACHG